MNFYTLDYILSHQSLDATRRLAAIIVLLVVALASAPCICVTG